MTPRLTAMPVRTKRAASPPDITVVFSMQLACVLVFPTGSAATFIERTELAILKKAADSCLSKYYSRG